MKQDCLDIGVIQAFMDGELDHGQSARVSGHIAVCSACSLMLADAEDESAIVFPALEREFTTLVPTQRLWAKINDSIATTRKNRPFWQKAWGYFGVGLMTPSLATAAGLLLVVGVTALVLINRGPASVDDRDVAHGIPAAPVVLPSKVNAPDIESRETAPVTPYNTPIRVDRADYRPAVRRSVATTADFRPSPVSDTSNGYMPGEESYIKTIASLSQSVNAQKDNSMRGGERISFERNMAVVDDAISKMRAEVKKNPKNESAKQVLYSSYQNKIDLLNSVSQREELVASLR